MVVSLGSLTKTLCSEESARATLSRVEVLVAAVYCEGREEVC
jgi:hypothetical protein